MKTDIFEADAFTGRKGSRIGELDSDYRFERNDEFFLKGGAKYRIIMVRVDIADGSLRRELHVMKL